MIFAAALSNEWKSAASAEPAGVGLPVWVGRSPALRGQQGMPLLPRPTAGPYALCFLRGNCYTQKCACRMARRVDLMSAEAIKEVIAAPGLYRCRRDVRCLRPAFVLPPLCRGAFCTPEAHLYCFKLSVKLIWVFVFVFFFSQYFFKKQDMLPFALVTSQGVREQRGGLTCRYSSSGLDRIFV